MSRDSMFPTVRPPPASVRFNNPGAMYPGPSAKKFGTTGTHIIGGGHKIAAFDDPVNGAAAQFDLLSRKYAGMRMGDAINMWSGGNFSPEYAEYIASKTGVSPSTVLTPELIANPSFAIPFAKASAEWESGLTKTGYPLSDEQWGSAHRMALGGAVPQQGEDEMQRTNVAMNGSISGGRPPAQLPAPMALGGPQPWVNPDTGAPVTAGDPSQFITTDVKSKRAKAFGDLLNNIAYQKEPVKHWADGASRAMAALLGGYQGKQVDQGEIDTRNAQMDMLPDASPLEKMILASGDKNATSSILSSRVRGDEKTDLQKNYEYAKKDGYAGSFEDFKKTGGIGSKPASIQELEYEKANNLPEGYFAQQRAEAAGLTAEAKQAAKGDTGKAIPYGAQEKMYKKGEAALATSRFIDDFKDEYAGYGNKEIGELAVSAKKYIPGADSSAANFWAGYAKQRNDLRHQLFGSALTTGETAAWNEADINPGMQPKAIRLNLAIQDAAAKNAARKLAKASILGGYKKEAVLAAFDVDEADLDKVEPYPKPDESEAAPTPKTGTTPRGAPTASAAPMPIPPDLPPKVMEAAKAGKTVRSPDGKRWRLEGGGLVEVK